MRVEPQQRDAHPTEDQSGSMNLPASVTERIKQLFLWSIMLRGSVKLIPGSRLATTIEILERNTWKRDTYW
ncbi:MAG: hypothetical protein WCC94_07640, partial [Candidatus Bathyarchaeia archaeon]